MDDQQREQGDKKPADATPEAAAVPVPAADGGIELTDEQLEKASGGIGSSASQMKKSLIANFPR